MKQNILRKKLIQIFKKNKLSDSHAKTVSDYLIKAEILDASSHGLARLKMYCDRIRKKVINPKPKLKLRKLVAQFLTLMLIIVLGLLQLT